MKQESGAVRKAIYPERPGSREPDKICEERKVFLMEAMWTRYLPAILKVREWLGKGLIGEVRFSRRNLGTGVPGIRKVGC